MFAGALLLPLVPFAVTAAVLGAVLLLRRVPAQALSAPVAAARRRNLTVAVVAVALTVSVVGGALAAGVAAGRNGQFLAVVPITAACLHTAVVLAGELSWPRPRGRVRSARLVARSIRRSAPRSALVLFATATGLLLLTCAAGTALAAGDGRSITWTSADGVHAGTSSPFPGAFYSLPVLVTLVLLVGLCTAVLHRLSARPAVLDAVADDVLRRAAGHRALRVATSAVLGTTAAFWVVGGSAAHGLGGTYGIDGVTYDAGPGAVWDTAAAVVSAAGGVLGLLALAVLLVPARRVQA